MVKWIAVVLMLMPAADSAAGPRVFVEATACDTVRYGVDAEDLPDFFARMSEAGRIENFPGRFAWNVSYTYEYGVDKEGIKVVTSTRIEPAWTIHLPTWPNASGLSPECRSVYDAAVAVLAAHENEHRDMFEQALGELEQRIRSMEAPSDKQFEFLIDDWRTRHESRQRRFDARTDHGTRDAVLEIPLSCSP